MARKKKDYTDVAKQLIDIVGKDNVVSLTHCETRLRFVVKNRKKIDDKAIQNLPDVKRGLLWLWTIPSNFWYRDC